MADKVNHWPSFANWYARASDGRIVFSELEPAKCKHPICWANTKDEGGSFGDGIIVGSFEAKRLNIVEIDHDTPWDQSLQRRPDDV